MQHDRKTTTQVIAINAVSGGGKSTTVDALLRRIPKAKALHFDDRDYASISGIDDLLQWELRGSDYGQWDLTLFEADLVALLEEKLDYIFLDYSFGYNQEQIAPYISTSIFIDTPLDMCLCRRLIRDYQEADAAEMMGHIQWYLNQGRQAFEGSVRSARKEADYVIDGSLDLNHICDRIQEVCDKDSSVPIVGKMFR